MLRKWLLMIAITSATGTGCSTVSEPEYPRLGTLQPTQTYSPLKSIQSSDLNRPLTDVIASVEPEEPLIEAVPENDGNSLSDIFYDHYKEWRGTRYRLGGLSKAGIDCSGFVYVTFLDRLGIELPRSTHYQVKRGKDIARNQLQTGDLVFFRNGRVNHVGIYLEDGKFMHSSTRSGVRISSMSNGYWQRSYWTARRLTLPDNLQLAQNP